MITMIDKQNWKDQTSLFPQSKNYLQDAGNFTA